MYDQITRSATASAIGTLLLAAAMVLAPASPAAAADNKGISATECQPFLPTTYETALFKDNAIHNPTNTNQRVICPVNKDTQLTWEAGNVDLEAYVKAGPTPGKVSCTLYGGGAAWAESQVAYTGTSAVIQPGQTAFIDIPNIASPGDNQDYMQGWNVLCTLNPGMSLGGFWMRENYATDGE